jgi:ABC-type bacteriocin/lantibiotic exporter with double-glycine peptidase domain
VRRRFGGGAAGALLFCDSCTRKPPDHAIGCQACRLPAVCELANAWEFIREWPEGLETLLVKAASKLSGGQRQRIAIGRALLYNPDFLLFDEATSTLDMVSEGLVKEALDPVLLGRTTIFHRTLTFHR